LTVVCWFVIGSASSFIHLWLLGRAVHKAQHLAPARAGKRIARGLPLRLLALAPILSLAAKAGLWACLGWALGAWMGRWVVLWYRHRYRARVVSPGR